jgi:hypothetical protein
MYAVRMMAFFKLKQFENVLHESHRCFEAMITGALPPPAVSPAHDSQSAAAARAQGIRRRLPKRRTHVADKVCACTCSRS